MYKYMNEICWICYDDVYKPITLYCKCGGIFRFVHKECYDRFTIQTNYCSICRRPLEKPPTMIDIITGIIYCIYFLLLFLKFIR